MSSAHPSPLAPRTALLLVLTGALGFVALLWSIGSGMADPAPQPSGAHVRGTGLTGYAALSAYLTARGYTVTPAQTRGALRQPGLLVLTPPHEAKPDALEEVIAAHRQAGPVMLIMPKWRTSELPEDPANAKVQPGFVKLEQAQLPLWPGFHDDLSVELGPLGPTAGAGQWSGLGLSGALPDPAQVASGSGRALVPLIGAGAGARIVAGYLADGGNYPGLRDLAAAPEPAIAASGPAGDAPAYPLIIVFDPDLFNNYGLARRENAALAEALLDAALDGALDGADRTAVFDLTLNGYGRSQNLLQLAFTPPFLAATVCLLLASLVVLWRAYHRFGPPVLAGRSIAFGKRALIANAAGLLRRARRLHLVGAPYAEAARERLAKALGLPQRLDCAATEAAIDRALAARAPAETPFSTVAANLRNARKPRDLLRAAQHLHSLERILLR